MAGRSTGTRLEARTRDGSSRSGGNLFLWTIGILILSAFAIGCWIFSFYVFGHPEAAFSYSILTKLKKLDPPKRFELTAAPRGEFLSPTQLWDRYNKMTDRELERTSEGLLRNYIRNYKLTQDLVPYVVGSFNILDSQELGEGDYFPTGVVALAQSSSVPQVLIEQVFTADKRVVPILQRMLLTGLDLRLDKTVDLSALVEVERLTDGRLLFTAVPLLYGNYAASTGPGTFSLIPPTRLNAPAGLPILKEEAITTAQGKLAAYQKRAGLDSAGGHAAARRSQNQLVRVERPKPVGGAAAPPVPATTPALPEEPAPVPLLATGSTTIPAPAGPAASPSPSPKTETIANTAGGAWPIYSPGQMPRGRLLEVPDMTQLTGQGASGERIYLQGNFIVTASGQNRAVLRTQGALAENLGTGARTSNTRIIVEFPSSSRPPAEGSTFSRDSRRPFLITDVRKGADGQVNVYVREVTHPQ